MNPKDVGNGVPVIRIASGKQGDSLTLTNRAYWMLRAAILGGEIQEGERLQERNLAAWLGASRTPVRGALQRLQAEGFLTETAEGIVVKTFSVQEIVDLYEMRISLEGISARLAAERATFGQITELKKVLGRMARATEGENLVELTEANREAHSLTAMISSSRFLVQFISLLHDSVIRLYSTTFRDSGRRKQSLEEHLRLLEAIERHDPAAAEIIAREHIANAQKVRLALITRVETAEPGAPL